METVFTSKRIFLNSASRAAEVFAGGLVISAIDGKVTRVLDTWPIVESYLRDHEGELEHFDFGDLLIMPGLVDTHVHINEPGRTEWEGFHTATKAAAAGGFTTICDMPLNSIPPTTSIANLRTKINAARGKIFVDVAFWGGLVPGNGDELRRMIAAGVIGFKCFLCPSGVDEFPHVTEEDVHAAARIMEGSGAVLAFHAEIDCQQGGSGQGVTVGENVADPYKYRTFLESRPDNMEQRAIELVSKVARQYDLRTHIVHLSTAQALPTIREARAHGGRLTVETCHHYLSLAAEDVPDAHTEFKCCPPIRGGANRELLWRAIQTGDIDLVVSDHSPSTPQMKLLTESKRQGNFLEAWGGISSLQLGLPLFWTSCQQYGLTLEDTVRLLCTEPARLSGLDACKGRLDPGYDGDLCVWDPEGTFTVTESMIEFQHKVTPYLNRTLRGVIHATFLRGFPIYQRSEPVPTFGPPLGNILLRSDKTTASPEGRHSPEIVHKPKPTGKGSVNELEDTVDL
ncbi:AGAP000239-PA-like protein [Anopheles sinensis]|uniref:allantoinase n=1 Tax=Anopheles sinensis TaxID=74873 RepID=A0A084VLM1_ANOSI|nr:AGAP000239-PA-like protein [Anopheles sinensis]